jgi:DNA mismatch endonuclease (patch repair protein)
MAAIRSTNTTPELLLRKALFKLGFRYRIALKRLPGRPDIVLPKHRAVIFVHGCFWHGHTCPKYRLPKSQTSYWAEKVFRNRNRDHDVQEKLLDAGWRVAVVWECAIKGPKREHRLEATVDALAAWLIGTHPELELPAGDPTTQVRAAPGGGAKQSGGLFCEP